MIAKTGVPIVDEIISKADRANVRQVVKDELASLANVYKRARNEYQLKRLLGHITKYWNSYNNGGFIFGYEKPSYLYRRVLSEVATSVDVKEGKKKSKVKDIVSPLVKNIVSVDEAISNIAQEFTITNHNHEIKIDAYCKKAIELILDKQSFFISGNAGTGKSFIINNIIEPLLHQLGWDYVLLAPTGIAAKNIKGATIHAQFRLPLSPYIPGIKIPNLYALDDEGIRIVQRIKVMIIDEISMVRCDMVDAIDDVLRKYRGSKEPFGGVQVIFVGDLYQLMPVATPEDWEKLKDKYKSLYFFSSQTITKNPMKMLELKTIHRQKDEGFKSILNSIRINTVTDYQLYELNKQVNTEFEAKQNDGYIRLCSLNKTAWGYNKGMLEKTPGIEKQYKGWTTGWYSRDDYPTDLYLDLKVGAEVMFVRNDTENGLFVNGTRGVIQHMGEGYVIVEKKDDKERIRVERMQWDCERYHINKVTKQLETEVIGTFNQLPLKLAWAITIHKSQGLQFNKAVIDVSRVFAAGQVYVALSRCKRKEGMVLTSKVTRKKVMIDEAVTEYMKTVERIEVDDSKEREELSELRKKLDGRGSIYFMAKDGMSADVIAQELGIRIEIVYNDLAHLIGQGLIDVHRYVNDVKYKAIMFAHKRSHSDDIKVIKELCPANVKYGEVNMVLESLKVKKDEFVLPNLQTVSDDIEENITSESENKIEQKEESIIPIVPEIEECEYDVKIDVAKDSFYRIANGTVKNYKKALINKEVAKDFVKNPNTILGYISPDRCPFVAKEIKTIRFSFDKEFVDVTVKKTSFMTIKTLQGKTVWVISFEFRKN